MTNSIQTAPDGYKLSEIGVIPNDWDIKELRSVIKVFRGGSPRPIESYLTTSPQGINWIKIGDVEDGAKYIERTDEKIIPEGISRSRQVHSGDFLLSNSMSFGRPYILKIDGCIHDGWLVLQDYQDTFNREFLYYILGSEIVIKQYLSKAAGSSVLNLNKELVSSVSLLTPKLPEQSAIASVLSDIDSLIQKTEILIAKKRLIRQGAMQKFLTGKYRLPGFDTGSGYKQTEIGMLPIDWEVKLLPEVLNFISGKAHEKYITENGKYIAVNSKFISSNGFVKKYTYKNFCPAYKGDVLMVMSDLPKGKALAKCYFVESDNQYAVNQRVCILRAISGYPKYFYYALNRNSYFLQFDDGVQQTHLLIDVFKRCPVIIPKKIEEQKALAVIFTDMDQEIGLLEQRLEKYNQIKQGAMQVLLSGKIRLIKN